MPEADVAALPDTAGTPLVLTADVSDRAGNPAVQATRTLAVDTLAPVAPGLALAADTGASAGDRLTRDARLTVAAEPGASLRYSLDGAPETAAYDPAALADGTHTVAATQTDAAGNVSAAASLGFTLDRTAPAVIALAPDMAGPTNAGSLTQTVTFSEAVTGLDAADFALVLTGTAAARIAAVSGSGAAYTVTLADVTGDGTLRLDLLADGTGIRDLAGNAVAGGFAGGVTALDHGVPGLTIDPVAGDGWISAAEHGTALVVAGTTTAEDGRIVTLGLAGRSYAATVAGGAWSITVPGGDVAALPDTAGTPLVLTADVSDRAGNPAVPATRSLAVDTTADAGGDAALTLDATTDTVVNAAEAPSVAFTLAGLDPDATAVATFSDGTTSRRVTLAANGPGRLDLSGLDGSVTGTLTITDGLGNTVTGPADPSCSTPWRRRRRVWPWPTTPARMRTTGSPPTRASPSPRPRRAERCASPWTARRCPSTTRTPPVRARTGSRSCRSTPRATPRPRPASTSPFWATSRRSPARAPAT